MLFEQGAIGVQKQRGGGLARKGQGGSTQPSLRVGHVIGFSVGGDFECEDHSGSIKVTVLRYI